MLVTMLKAKLHRARVTRVERDYEGSCAIDAMLLDEAGIREYEQIQIYNVDNGERFTTYAIRAERGTGVISINGAASHRAAPGHRLIICAYAMLDEQELALYRPTLIYLDEANRILGKRDAIPVQAA
ncbi:MAG: aspartate 1-decarboxylase [Gammaproteobacteria bacterium]